MIEDHKSKSDMSSPVPVSEGACPSAAPPGNEGIDPRSNPEKFELVCGVSRPFSEKEDVVDAC